MTGPRGAVIAQHLSGTQWQAWGHDRSAFVRGPERFEPQALARLGEAISAAFGGPEARIVVLVVPGAPSGKDGVVAEYPRRVHAISPKHALACILPAAWRKAIVVDCAGRVDAALVFGDGEDGCEREQALECATADEVALVGRSLGVEHWVVRCGEQTGAASDYIRAFGRSATIVNDGLERTLRGARRFASRQVMRGAGVWTETPRSTVLRANRAVSYSILRTAGSAFEAGDDTLATIAGREVLLVVDGNVDRLYGPAIRRYARLRLDLRGYVTADASESAKDWYEVESICRAAVDGRLGRSGAIVGVGGGITLDVAGMAASIYRRGVSFVRVPTTLVGLVDVAVGIKQGVNAFGHKNLLGSFYPPVASLNDYGFLRTSPRSSIACGMAEILKMAVVRDESLLDALEQDGPALLASRFQSPEVAAHTIARRAEILMMEELAPNLFETDLRRLVDFGHTFSPVVETSSKFTIPHGHAVALDMLLSAAIAARKGLCSPGFRDRLARLLPTLGLSAWHVDMPEAQDLKNALERARVHRGGSLNLVAPAEAGEAVFIQDVSDGELRSALEWMCNNGHHAPALFAGANGD